MGSLGLLGAGCGGSSAPTKVAYDKQANAICASYNAKLKAAGAALSGSTSRAEAEKSLSGAISLAQQGTSRLESLKRPNGESAQLQKAFSAQQAQITDLRSLLTAIQEDSATKAKAALAKADSSTASVKDLFDTVGLRTCGSSSSS
jgi:hypothetical protein